MRVGGRSWEGMSDLLPGFLQAGVRADENVSATLHWLFASQSSHRHGYLKNKSIGGGESEKKMNNMIGHALFGVTDVG